MEVGIEHVLGLYEDSSGSSKTNSIFITSTSLIVLVGDRKQQIFYNDIIDIELDDEANINCDSPVTLTQSNGQVLTLAFHQVPNGGDVFRMFMFLESVCHNVEEGGARN